MTPSKIDRAVKSAARILDKAYPGWEKKIKVKNLNMQETDKCVLGQVTGGNFWGHSLENVVGFGGRYDPSHCTEEKEDKFFKDLKTRWIEEIKTRKN